MASGLSSRCGEELVEFSKAGSLAKANGIRATAVITSSVTPLEATVSEDIFIDAEELRQVLAGRFLDAASFPACFRAFPSVLPRVREKKKKKSYG